MKILLNKYKGVLLLLVFGLLIASCGTGTPATPTTDPNLLFTQVAETVSASIDQTSAAIPTNTPVPTQEPTATQIPLPTVDPNAIPTQAPAQSGFPTPTVQRYGDVALWTGQSPSDMFIVKQSSSFTFHGCMNNVGTTTWSPDYVLKYASGPDLWPKQRNWPIPDEIKPGEKSCYDIPAIAPVNPGTYTTWWDFTNKGVMFYQVYFKFIVVE